MTGLGIRDLRVRVGNFEAVLPALDIAKGELVCLVGRSGSGKTTLLNAIAGFLPAASGTISLNDRDLTALPPEKRGMALVFQRPALFPHLSVLQNVEFGLRCQGMGAERSQRAAQWLGRLGIGDLAARRPSEVSEGQGQRVSIARALAVGFSGLLLDEPFSALDVGTRRELRDVLRREISEGGIAALMVTHHPDDALAIADRIVVLQAGRVIWQGAPSEVRSGGIPNDALSVLS